MNLTLGQKYFQTLTSSHQIPHSGHSRSRSWKFLRQHGQPVPARLEDLIGQAYWDYLKENNLPRPTLEELEKLGADRQSRF